MTKSLFTVWLASIILCLLVAQVFFTGEQSSEIVGDLSFVLLILCFPLSIIGFPLALVVVYFFESQGLFPYNSRLILSVWWSVFFVCGLLQWFVIFKFINSNKS